MSAPGAEAFALLFALESLSRALLATVIPLEALKLLDDARGVSVLFFVVSCISLCGNLTVPCLIRRSARRWVYSTGAILLIGAGGLLALGGLPAQVGGMAVRVLGIVAMTICINLYIMDNIPRHKFTRTEPMRMFYSAGAWTAGPALGVYLRAEVADWAPYALSSAVAVLMLAYFWFLRMTERPIFSGPADRAPGPLTNLRRFAGQPRLLLAWSISAGRNAWWTVFFIYTPIYTVQSGLGEVASGVIVSLGTGFLFLMPLWGWCTRRFGIRRTLITGFAVSGVATTLVGGVAGSPLVVAALLVLAALAMVSLDAVSNVPFMLAVRPRERAEMTSVYSTYRDIAEMGPPGFFVLLLQIFSLPAVFVAGGLAMLALAGLSSRMHPRLGLPRSPARRSPPALAPERQLAASE